ncbi:MAG TPA: hypothetical protein DCY54_02120 [Parachlamydiales bacterium]|nr:hypothetical protein [Parachlamydiales bacterium]
MSIVTCQSCYRNTSSNAAGIFEIVGTVIRYFTGAPNPNVVNTASRLAEEMRCQSELNWSSLSEDDLQIFYIFEVIERDKGWYDQAVEKVNSLFFRQPEKRFFTVISEEEEAIRDARAKRRSELEAKEEEIYDSLRGLFSVAENISSPPPTENGNWKEFICIKTKDNASRASWGDKRICPPQYLFGSIVESSLKYSSLLSDRFANKESDIRLLLDPNHMSVLLDLASVGFCCEKSTLQSDQSLSKDVCQCLCTGQKRNS